MNLPKNGVAWVVRGIVEKNTCPNYIPSVNVALVEDILEKCQFEINVGKTKKKNKTRHFLRTCFRRFTVSREDVSF